MPPNMLRRARYNVHRFEQRPNLNQEFKEFPLDDVLDENDFVEFMPGQLRTDIFQVQPSFHQGVPNRHFRIESPQYANVAPSASWQQSMRQTQHQQVPDLLAGILPAHSERPTLRTRNSRRRLRPAVTFAENHELRPRSQSQHPFDVSSSRFVPAFRSTTPAMVASTSNIELSPEKYGWLDDITGQFHRLPGVFTDEDEQQRIDPNSWSSHSAGNFTTNFPFLPATLPMSTSYPPTSFRPRAPWNSINPLQSTNEWRQLQQQPYYMWNLAQAQPSSFVQLTPQQQQFVDAHAHLAQARSYSFLEPPTYFQQQQFPNPFSVPESSWTMPEMYHLNMHHHG